MLRPCWRPCGLTDPSFCTGFAEREYITLTGPALCGNSRASFRPFATQSDRDHPQSHRRIRLAFFPESLGRPALVGFTTPSLHDFLRLRQRVKDLFVDALVSQLPVIASKVGAARDKSAKRKSGIARNHMSVFARQNFDVFQTTQHPVILRGAPFAPRKISTDASCAVLIEVLRRSSSDRLRMTRPFGTGARSELHLARNTA